MEVVPSVQFNFVKQCKELGGELQNINVVEPEDYQHEIIIFTREANADIGIFLMRP